MTSLSNLPINPWEVRKRVYWTFDEHFSNGVDTLCVWGGIGAGKTVGLCQFIHDICLNYVSVMYDKEGNEIYAPLEVLITGDSYNTLKNGLWKIHSQILRCDLKRQTPFAKVDMGEMRINVKYNNGSHVYYTPLKLDSRKTSEQSAIEGQSPNLLISDETQKMDDRFVKIATERARGRELLNPRTGHRRSFMKIFAGVPGPNDTYLRLCREYKDKGMNVEFYYPKTTDMHPYNGPYVQNQFAVNPPGIAEVKMQLIPGSTMPAETSIFSMFTPLEFPQGNLLCVPHDPTRETWVAMDFNVDQPSVLLLQEFEVAGKLRSVIVDEFCPDGETLVTDLVDYVTNSPYYETIKGIIVDPAGKARNVAATAGSITDILRKPTRQGGTGKKVFDKHPTGDKRLVEDGVLKVQARFCNGDGERELLVRKDLWENPKYPRGIKHTIQSYRRDSNTRVILTGTKGDNADHIADALRYYVRIRCWTSLNDQTPVKDFTFGMDPRSNQRSFYR